MSAEVGTQSADTWSADWPASSRLSILICTYNRADTLKVALDSLALLAADKQLYEIIVVNNNCTDHTSEVCQSFAVAHPDTQFRHVMEPQPGVSFARNRAIAEAKYEVLAFIDDDVTVLPNYVDAIIKAFEDYPEYNAGGGKTSPAFEGGAVPKYLSKYLNPFAKVDYGDTTQEWPAKTEAKYPPGCNMFFRKEVFEKYGNFNEKAIYHVEDKDIFHRLKLNNEKVLYVPAAFLHHHMPKERFSYKGVTKIGYQTGMYQVLWLKDLDNSKNLQKIMFTERIFKFAVSIGLGAFYCLTFRPQKARYLISYMYNMTKGYFKYR